MNENKELPGQELFYKWALDNEATGFKYLPLSLFSLAIQERDAEWKARYDHVITQFEKDFKLSVRLNKIGATEVEQEDAWQSYKKRKNL